MCDFMIPLFLIVTSAAYSQQALYGATDNLLIPNSGRRKWAGLDYLFVMNIYYTTIHVDNIHDLRHF